jgi:hypothetical protein
MPQYGTWVPYTGSDAVILAVVLFFVAGVLTYLGTRLNRPVGVERPGNVVSLFLIVLWVLSLATFLVAITIYGSALTQQAGPITLPANPITPVTSLSVLVTFIVITYVCRGLGWKVALGSAAVGTIAAPLIFELPFDLIVMWRTYAPTPVILFTLLYFLPLFLVEISSFALLTLSPAMRVSRYTLFFLAAMFFVFAVWAVFGFSYPATPVPFVCNAVSKILSFIVAITLFLP